MGCLSLITIYVHTRMFKKKKTANVDSWLIDLNMCYLGMSFYFFVQFYFVMFFLFVCLIFQTILVHHPLITFLSLDQAKNCIIKNLDLSQTRAQLNSKVKGSLQNWYINFHRICPFMITLMISKYLYHV